MKKFIRILIAVLALVGIIAWTMFTSQVWQFGNSFKGMGDGAGTGDSSGSAMLSILLIAVIWFLPASPYLCMAAGSLNLITGKLLRAAYVYSLIVLTLMSLIELVIFQRAFKLIVLGNIVAGGLWAYAFREDTPEKR